MSTAVPRVTEPQRRALAALADLQDAGRLTSARNIAKALWPDSPAWEQRTRRYGRNANGAVGGTMPMKAATLLWRLHAHGLVLHDTDEVGVATWSISARGRQHLADTDPTTR